MNEIDKQAEKSGGRKRLMDQILTFHEMMFDCNLMDAGFQGPKFTWSGIKNDGVLIKERLDRGLVNGEWIQKFLNTQISHLVANGSNHSPLIINLCKKG